MQDVSIPQVLRDHGQRFLVGNQLSLADIILLQTILALEEKIPNILSAFPHLQVNKTASQKIGPELLGLPPVSVDRLPGCVYVCV